MIFKARFSRFSYLIHFFMKNNILIFLKGLAMGAADVVPGVSGGTIAFITGIYEKLISSINEINLSLFNTLKKDGFKAVWIKVNGTFLSYLFAGIATSILTLAKLIKYLLDHESVLVWSFFFGLILASVFFVGKQVGNWNGKTITAIILGTVIAYYISSINSTVEVEGLWYVFLCGAVAICAMILPGISGSFILLLMGAYYTVLSAAKDFNIQVIIIFMLGALTGLLSFSKLLNYLFKHFEKITLAFLTGFLLGSLNKIWPWQQIVSTRINSHGKMVPFITKNVLPNKFHLISKAEQSLGFLDKDPMLASSIILTIVGFAIIIIMDMFSPKKAPKS